MKNSPNISLKSIKRSLAWFFHRFHLTIFAIGTIGGLAVATFFLYGIITYEPPVPDQASSIPSFDEDTMERIMQLKTSSEQTPDLSTISYGKRNPFVEQ